MRNFTATTSAILAYFAMAGTALAADLGGSIKDEPDYAPPAVSVFSWTGFYAGLQTGYAWGETNYSFSNSNVTGGADPDGWLGGGYAGYNWQSGNLMFGFEADIEAGDVGGSFSTAGGTILGSTDLNWQGSLRGRIGLAADRTLFYITGGWAFGDADVDGSIPGTPLGCCSESVSLDGWTLGGGMEYAVTNNFTVRAEYRYTDFGEVSVDLPNVNVTMPVEVETHALRVGAGWKF